MATTIQVHEDVLQRLNAIKKETGARSTEEVIKMLLKNAKALKKSHFGTLPKMRPFEREEIDRLG